MNRWGARVLLCCSILARGLTRVAPHADLAFSALQGRQKLARFNAREFATLIIDILSEAKRRQQGKSLSSPTGGDLARAGHSIVRPWRHLCLG